MQIFLSYSSSDRAAADRLQLALRHAGYKVFFDRDDLRAGSEFDAKIREQVYKSDLLIFLVSVHSLREGCYAQEELAVARAKWPAPSGRVLPVLLDDLRVQDLPPYLASVTVLPGHGEVALRVVQAVHELDVGFARRAFMLAKSRYGKAAMFVVVAGGVALAYQTLAQQPSAQLTPEEIGRRHGRAVTSILKAIEDYRAANGQYPKTLNAINARDAISALVGYPYEYTQVNRSQAKFIFSGADKRLGTADDRVYLLPMSQ